MDRTLEKIKKLPLVVGTSEIKFNSKIKHILRAKLTKEQFKSVSKNSNGIRIFRIHYKSQDHEVSGFILEPKNDNKKLPCIIWNRGGSGDFGSIKYGNLFYSMANFAIKGYIVIASNYSGSTGSEGKDEFGGKDIYDVLNLYKILKGYSRADISRIGMYGWSRGGLMTYLALSKVNNRSVVFQKQNEEC